MKSKKAPPKNKIDNKCLEVETVSREPSVEIIKTKWFIPLVIAIAVVPLIVMAHKFKTGDLTEYSWFDTGTEDIDLFLFYKGLILEMAAGVIIFLMAFLTWKRKPALLKDKRNISPIVAVGIFAVLTLVSSILSEHRETAILGGGEHFEGLLTVLSYVICFVMAFGFARSEDIIKYVLNALLVSSFVIGLLGALETIGVKLFLTNLAGHLFSLLEFSKDPLVMQDYMPFSYSTLYNPNYVGSYVPLVLPFTVYLTIFGEKLDKKVLAGTTSVLLLITLYGSKSEAGMIGAAVATGVAFLLFLPRMKRRIRIVALAVAAFAIAGAAYIVISRGIIQNVFVDTDTRVVENIRTDGYGVVITTRDGKKIRANLDAELLKTMGWSQSYPIEDKLIITDEASGEKLSTTITEADGTVLESSSTSSGVPSDENETLNIVAINSSAKHVSISQEGYPAISFFIDIGEVTADRDPKGFGFLYDQFHVVEPEAGLDWIFSGEDDGTLRYCVGLTGKLAPLRDIKRSGFIGRYTFASGRGYIWACTNPQLTNYLFTGAGRDNYIYVFPNDDYVGRTNWWSGEVVNKPHNMFLQIWVQDGLIALLAFLALWFIFIIRAIRLSFGRNKVPVGRVFSAWGVVAMTTIGTSAYMVVGIANDSIVCVAPVYWVMLGIGYAAEAVCRKNMKSQTETSSKTQL